MDAKILTKKKSALDEFKLRGQIATLLDGNRSQFRLVDSVVLRKPWFDKRIKKDRKKSKMAKASRKRNR